MESKSWHIINLRYGVYYVVGSKTVMTTVRERSSERALRNRSISFNSYPTAQYNDVDVMICDEAHRIRAISNKRFTKADNAATFPRSVRS
ncbi:DNA/RNA helicase domain-containing protein [Acidipila sp. EB88]|uniref:DNA/RNA helicase domain-containing protein n=1 Tax=Acidipila sp. EB88 TaxID=2305226 RepID=UPI0026B93827